MKEHDQCSDTKKCLKQVEKELETSKEVIRKLKEDTVSRTQEEKKQEEKEKQSLHQMISKLTQEKERVQELQ